MVHEGLECGWRIAKPKEHYCWFEESEGGNEGSFPLVFFTDMDVVVAPPDVEFCEEGDIFYVVNELWNKW